MNPDILISLTGVTVRRGDFTLDIPEWTVRAGDVVGRVGPNGAGKSTLLQLLPGLMRPDSGAVSVLGADPWVDPVGVRRGLGYMTDDMPLYLTSVGALLSMLSRYYPTWDDGRVTELMGRFGLDSQARVDQLSKGQGTRLRLLVALAHRPRLVLLDEPATGLDLSGRHSLLQTVLEVVSDPGVAVIISSHQLADVERVADRLVVLRGAQSSATDPPTAWWLARCHWKSSCS
ncbi:MAG: ABC-2 type transport system ATP-binding protein, partial [Myxococcota bacterium]